MILETLSFPPFADRPVSVSDPHGPSPYRTAAPAQEAAGLLGGLMGERRDDFTTPDCAVSAALQARLRGWLQAPGRRLDLVARSPRVREELDLLVRLDHQHALTVHLALPAVDHDLAHGLLGEEAAPAEMLAAARELSSAGIAVVLRLAPLLPGINDGGGPLRRWLAAARKAGASDVEAELLELSPWKLRRWLDRLARWEPGLTLLHRRLYSPLGRLRGAERRALLERFASHRRLAGFPRALAGRG